MTKNLQDMTGPELVAEWNRRHPEKPIKKFADRKSALKRLGETTVASGTAPKTKGAGGELIAEFGVREGSNRSKLLGALGVNRMVKRSALLKELYGSGNEKNIGALSMVFKGLQITINNDKLKYDIRREKDQNKEVAYGIFKR